MVMLPKVPHDDNDNHSIRDEVRQLRESINHLIEIKNLEHGQNRLALENLAKVITKHDEFIFGNGKPGIIVTLDRLVQSADNQKWMSRMLMTTTVSLIAKTIWDILAGR